MGVSSCCQSTGKEPWKTGRKSLEDDRRIEAIEIKREMEDCNEWEHFIKLGLVILG